MDKRLIPLVIEVLKREKRRYACEARIEEALAGAGGASPTHKRALQRYRLLGLAIKELESEQEHTE